MSSKLGNKKYHALDLMRFTDFCGRSCGRDWNAKAEEWTAENEGKNSDKEVTLDKRVVHTV